MKTKHVALMVGLGMFLVVLLPLAGVLGLAVVYYTARNTAAQQYREAQDAIRTEAPGPSDSYAIPRPIQALTRDGATVSLEVRLAHRPEDSHVRSELIQRQKELHALMEATLSSYESTLLSSAEGKLELQSHMRAEINATLDSGEVTAVYFQEFQIGHQ